MDIMKVAARILCVVLAVGAVLSAILAALGLAVFPQNLSGSAHYLAVAMLALLVPAWIGFVVIHQKMVRDLTPRQVDTTAISDCPGWLLWGSRIVVGVGAVLFFFPMIAAGFGYGPADPNGFPSS